MRGGGRKRGRKKAGLTPEDEALWRQFSKTVHPLELSGRVGDDSAKAQDKNDSRETTEPQSDGRSLKTGSAKSQPVTPKGPKTSAPGPKSSGQKQKARAGVAAFDDRHARRIGSGRSSIDARLDLHGLRQSEARSTLRRFLFSAMAKGYRTVLVITGKGGPDIRDIPWDGSESEGRGVLKRMVPIWLRDPEIAIAVVSYTTAHARHGGDGALYIHVRRQGRV